MAYSSTPTTPLSPPRNQKKTIAEITETSTPSSSSTPPVKRKATRNPKRKQPTTKKMKKEGSDCSPVNNRRNRRRKIEKEIDTNHTNNEDHLESKAIKKRRTRKLQEPKSKEVRVSKPNIESSGNDVREFISELVMWKNVTKTTLWFGSGSMILLSSCFSRDIDFSIVSTASHLGLLVLGMNFFRGSLPWHQQNSIERKLQLTEDDFLRVARLVMPVGNAFLAKCQEILSGEPSMVLKVAPVLLFTAQFGHLITAWRLFATGFFLSFTLPKFYTTYSGMIHKRVEKLTSYVKEAWKSCPRKKLVATSAAMLFWNLCSVKTRIFAAFISVAVLRHTKQSYWKGP